MQFLDPRSLAKRSMVYKEGNRPLVSGLPFSEHVARLAFLKNAYRDNEVPCRFSFEVENAIKYKYEEYNQTEEKQGENLERILNFIAKPTPVSDESYLDSCYECAHERARLTDGKSWVQMYFFQLKSRHARAVATVLMDRGKWKDAYNACRYACKIDPGSASAFATMAKVCISYLNSTSRSRILRVAIAAARANAHALSLFPSGISAVDYACSLASLLMKYPDAFPFVSSIIPSHIACGIHEIAREIPEKFHGIVAAELIFQRTKSAYPSNPLVYLARAKSRRDSETRTGRIWWIPASLVNDVEEVIRIARHSTSAIVQLSSKRLSSTEHRIARQYAIRARVIDNDASLLLQALRVKAGSVIEATSITREINTSTELRKRIYIRATNTYLSKCESKVTMLGYESHFRNLLAIFVLH